VNMTASEQPTYLAWSGTNYGWLNGVSGNYFSSPDSAAVDITGDIDLRAYVALNDWTPSATNVILSKWAVTGNQRSFQFNVTTAGSLGLQLTADGSTIVTYNSVSSVPASDRSAIWVRCTFDADNGSGSSVARFFTSSDGNTWTQLGADSTLAATSIFQSSAQLEVGSINLGVNPVSGLIYRAQIYNGINGTLAFDFNPAAYTSGTTFLDSSSNAATITLNGGSTVVTRTKLYYDGTDDSLKSAQFSQSQPTWINLVGSQNTWTINDVLIDGNAAASGQIVQTTATPQLNINAGSSVAANTGLAIKTRGLLQAVLNGASSSLAVNNGTETTGNAGAASMNGLVVGASGTPANYANMTESELAIYSGAPSAAQKSAWYLYALRKWGF